MIVGIGTDIVEIERVARLLARYGERFLRRVFTEVEEAYAARSARTAERLAGRFAVKEAALKALGTGKSRDILWRDVETVPGPLGRPVVKLHGAARTHMEKLGGTTVHGTIAHDGGKAIAFVIIEKADKA